mgnify:CR=1 FL=1
MHRKITYMLLSANGLTFRLLFVSRAVGLLKSGGYVLMDKDGFLTLTDAGQEVAEKIYERHCYFKQRLIDVVVDEKEACRLEHSLSDDSFDRIKKATDGKHNQ